MAAALDPCRPYAAVLTASSSISVGAHRWQDEETKKNISISADARRDAQVAEDVVMEASQGRKQPAPVPNQPSELSVTADMAQLAISELDSRAEPSTLPDASTQESAHSIRAPEAEQTTDEGHSDTATSAEHTYDESTYDDASSSSESGHESSSHPDPADGGFLLAGSNRRLVELVGLKLDGLDVLDPYQLHIQACSLWSTLNLAILLPLHTAPRSCSALTATASFSSEPSAKPRAAY